MVSFQASDLSEMDLAVFGGKSDPYLRVTVDPPEVYRMIDMSCRLLS